jgi:multimeric flavodoxin WrbA
MTNVVAINGSPKAEKGNTEKILAPFLTGMIEAGATVERYYVRKLSIKPCTGEFICWNTKLGTCHIKDDMQTLYPKLRQADVLVLATPVYIPLPGEMQNFINRLCPLIEPHLSFKEGRTRAIFHTDVKINKIALVSSSGWWEIGNFGTVLRIAKELAADASVKFVGALLRPHSDELEINQEKAKQIYEASKKAGFDLITRGRIKRATLEIISQPLISEEEYRRANNDSLDRRKTQRGKKNVIKPLSSC